MELLNTMDAESNSFVEMEEDQAIPCKDLGDESDDETSATELTSPFSDFINDQKFECRLCHFCSDSPEEIEDHVHVHACEKMYQSFYECSQCYDWIMSEINLKKHLQGHLLAKEESESNETKAISSLVSDSSQSVAVENDCFPTESIIEEKRLSGNDGADDKKIVLLNCSVRLKRLDLKNFECLLPPQNDACSDTSSKSESDHSLVDLSNKRKNKHRFMVGTVDCSARTKTKKSYDKRICNKKDEVTIRYESHKCLKKFPSPSQNDSITKKFICDICTRHFSTKKLLRLHMVRHVGIKQFSCLVCSKKFFTSSELRKHTNYWHPGNVMYQCVECSQAFRWYVTFAEHMRKEHKRRVKQKSSNVEFR